MDGVARPAGAPVSFQVPDGHPLAGTWYVGALGVGEFAEIEQYMLSHKHSAEEMLEQIEQIANPRTRQALLKMAYADMKTDPEIAVIPALEVMEYMESARGLVRTFWMALQKRQPNVTVEQAAVLINFVGPRKAKRLRDQAAGVDWRGNSTGSGDSGATPEPTSETDDQATSPPNGENTSPGEEFTASSRPSTAGPLRSSTD